MNQTTNKRKRRRPGVEGERIESWDWRRTLEVMAVDFQTNLEREIQESETGSFGTRSHCVIVGHFEIAVRLMLPCSVVQVLFVGDLVLNELCWQGGFPKMYSRRASHGTCHVVPP